MRFRFLLPLSIASLFVSPLNAPQVLCQWIPQESNTNVDLNGVHFVDTLHGWAVGNTGTILHTTDGGINWLNQNSGSDSKLRSVSFSDHNNGYATGGSGTILRTSNGGTSWTRILHDTSRNVTHFKVQSFGRVTYILRNYFDIDYWTDYRVWKTEDWGNTWSQVTPYNSFNDRIYDMHFVDSVYGWTCGDGAIPFLYHAEVHGTTNGGGSWNTVTFARQYQSILKVFFLDRTSGWALKPDTVFRSTNGGQTWIAIGTSFMVYASDLVMFGDTGYASVDTWTPFLRTTNGGVSWMEQSAGSIRYMKDLSFVSPTIGWAVGIQGRILHTTNGGVTSVHDHNRSQIPGAYALNQNHPNPFNPTTTITYELRVAAHVSLKLFDILGREVMSLVDEVKEAGYHQATLNASQLASGIYFYRMSAAGGTSSRRDMQAGSFTQTRKLVLLR